MIDSVLTPMIGCHEEYDERIDSSDRCLTVHFRLEMMHRLNLLLSHWCRGRRSTHECNKEMKANDERASQEDFKRVPERHMACATLMDVSVSRLICDLPRAIAEKGRVLIYGPMLRRRLH